MKTLIRLLVLPVLLPVAAWAQAPATSTTPAATPPAAEAPAKAPAKSTNPDASSTTKAPATAPAKSTTTKATAEEPKPLPKPRPTVSSTGPTPPDPNAQAATVALVTGSVTVRSPGGTRSLSKGDVIRAGETLVVGANSYANLRFLDGGRVLLRPNTEFTVEAYAYRAPPAPDPAQIVQAEKQSTEGGAGRAFFRLVRGGFRAISGLIGRDDAQDYRVTTPVATIGIRGTDYEVQTCTEDCPDEDLPDTAGGEPAMVAATDMAGVQLAQAGGGGGIVVATNAGSIVMTTPRGEFVVNVGEVAYALAGGQVFMMPIMPEVLMLNLTPSPEACE